MCRARHTTNVRTGPYNAAAGLKLGCFGKFIINQPSVQRPVKPVLSTLMKEYVEKKRREVGQLTKAMLDGTVHYLEGAIKLASLYHELNVPEGDQDFSIFIGISSEIDHLPIGSVREHWSDDALKQREQEIQESIKWAKEISLQQCKSLNQRFGA